MKAIMLALAILGTSAYAQDVQTTEQAAQAKRDMMTKDELVQDYQTFMTNLIPSYNYIKAQVGRHHYHTCLVALHPFFNEYAFTVGPLAGHVAKWINEHQTALQKAKIKEVGVAREWDYGPQHHAYFRLN